MPFGAYPYIHYGERVLSSAYVEVESPSSGEELSIIDGNAT